MDAQASYDSTRSGWDPRLTRLKRLGRARAWSSQGSIGGFAAASIAGFDPVGQVFGTTVAYLQPIAYDRCYVTSSAKGADKTSADPYNPFLGRLTSARTLAFERVVAECRALGGDGIIGMRMNCVESFMEATEFTVEGTAVRARSQNRPTVPFTTHVGGQDLAKLLGAGWMPFALVFGTGIAAGHFDPLMFQQTQRGVGAAANQEVSGYTRIVNDARRQARKELDTAVRFQGGEGAVLQESTLHFTERECPLGVHRSDYVVEATILGSAIVSFQRTGPIAPRAPLAIMRLDRRTEATVAKPELGPDDGTAGPSLGDRAYALWNGRGETEAIG